MDTNLSKGKRTGINFSEHEVIITEQEGLLVHYFKKPNTIMNSIKFINTNGILAVTGDFGNWIFCREFHPSADGYVSEGYWNEKLSINSEQTCSKFDSEETEKELQKMLDEHQVLEDILNDFKEYNNIDEDLDNDNLIKEINSKDDLIFKDSGNINVPTNDLDDILGIFEYEEYLKEEDKEFIEELISSVDDELDYTSTAYRNSYYSGTRFDYENIPYYKTTHRWLLIIYDGFDEICRRMKLEENK
jgi:hypothetical protein